MTIAPKMFIFEPIEQFYPVSIRFDLNGNQVQKFPRICIVLMKKGVL